MNDTEKILSQIADLDEKIKAAHRFMQSTHTMMKALSRHMDVLKEIVMNARLVTPEEFDRRVDNQGGLRVRDASERVAIGDLVWVSLQIKTEGEETHETHVVRAGSGVLFDQVLIGAHPGTRGIEFEREVRGEKVCFIIDIERVKTARGEHVGSSAEGEAQLEG